MIENKRWNKDERSSSTTNKETSYFRGLSLGEEVQHAFDHTARGRVTKIVIPIVYVQMNGRTDSHPMDRDELLGQDQQRELRLRRENRRKKDDNKKRWQKPAAPKRDELPDFEPELPPR